MPGDVTKKIIIDTGDAVKEMQDLRAATNRYLSDIRAGKLQINELSRSLLQLAESTSKVVGAAQLMGGKKSVSDMAPLQQASMLKQAMVEAQSGRGGLAVSAFQAFASDVQTRAREIAYPQQMRRERLQALREALASEPTSLPESSVYLPAIRRANLPARYGFTSNPAAPFLNAALFSQSAGAGIAERMALPPGGLSASQAMAYGVIGSGGGFGGGRLPPGGNFPVPYGGGNFPAPYGGMTALPPAGGMGPQVINVPTPGNPPPGGFDYKNSFMYRSMQRMALFGSLYNAYQLTQGYARAQGAGQPFDLSTNLGNIAGLAGFIGTGFNPLGYIAGKGIGGIGDAFFGGQEQRNQTLQGIAGTTGFTRQALERAANQVGRQADPNASSLTKALRSIAMSPFANTILPGGGILNLLQMTGLYRPGEIGSTLAAQGIGALDNLRTIGLSNDQIKGLAGQSYGPGLSPDILGKALAPFANDPLTAARMRGYSTLSGFKEYFGTPGNLESGVVTQGLSSTLGALNALPYSQGFGDSLRNRAIAFSQRYATLEAKSGIAGSGASVGLSRLQSMMATGAAPDSAQALSAQSAQLKAGDAYAKALQSAADSLRPLAKNNVELAAKVADMDATIESVKSDLATRRQAYHAGAVAFGAARLSTSASVLGSTVAGERFGLSPGSIAPSRGALEAVHRAQLANAEARSRDMSLPAEQRLSAQQEAAGLRNVVKYADPLARIDERFGIPARIAGSFSERRSAYLGTRMQEGAGIGELLPLLSENVGNRRQALAKEQQLLDRLAGQGIKGEPLEEQAARRDSARIALMEAQRLQAYAPGETELARRGRRFDMAQANAGAVSALGLGPGAELSASKSVLLSMGTQRQSLLALASQADRMKDTEAADQYRSQAAVLGSQMASGAISALSSFNPSAASRLALGNNSTAISLMANNPFGMGVSPSLYRERIGLLGQQISGIQARMQGVPDAVKANLQPQLSSLLLEQQQAQIKLREGNLGQLFSLSIGAPNGMNFVTQNGSLAPAQAFGRRSGRGTPRMLGGTVEPAPLFNGALLGGGGSSDGETNSLLRQIRDAVVAGNSGGNPSPSTAAGPAVKSVSDNDPYTVAKKLSGQR